MYFKEFAILTKLVVLVLHLEFLSMRKKFWKKYKNPDQPLFVHFTRSGSHSTFFTRKTQIFKNASIQKEYFSFFFFKAYRKIHSTTETKITFSAI